MPLVTTLISSGVSIYALSTNYKSSKANLKQMNKQNLRILDSNQKDKILDLVINKASELITVCESVDFYIQGFDTNNLNTKKIDSLAKSVANDCNRIKGISTNIKMLSQTMFHDYNDILLRNLDNKIDILVGEYEDIINEIRKHFSQSNSVLKDNVILTASEYLQRMVANQKDLQNELYISICDIIKRAKINETSFHETEKND